MGTKTVGPTTSAGPKPGSGEIEKRLAESRSAIRALFDEYTRHKGHCARCRAERACTTRRRLLSDVGELHTMYQVATLLLDGLRREEFDRLR